MVPTFHTFPVPSDGINEIRTTTQFYTNKLYIAYISNYCIIVLLWLW
jgi:hypothetical protein